MELVDPHLRTSTLEDDEFSNNLYTILSLYFFTPPSIMPFILVITIMLGMRCTPSLMQKGRIWSGCPPRRKKFPSNAYPALAAGAKTTSNLQIEERDYEGQFACMEVADDIYDFFATFYNP
ncbi:hypothetical protein CC78DRAFT_575840 [Lojkania enalia]|uniref:Uncharacterized protein n=1 Tax=Lojkania enalia TaxID=147567 RepID=A0A9P4N994_9PLEO|nr:hypothetical protein CC78DRAFT_575840 [Didymosphaeria enalia]